MSVAPDDSLGAALREVGAADPVELAAARADVLANVFENTPMVVRIGRYVVGDRIGAGAHAVVYGAYDPELHRRVAVKLLRSRKPQAGPASELALREARAVASLAHPNVVAIHDVGATAEGVFFVMELVAGATLDAWLAAAPRRWTEVLDALVPIARALQAAHARGLVHRDVKPQNVLMGDDGRPRLADFGLVAIEADDPFAGAIVGTPTTMAPEQHGGRACDARSDQYGFCATLHLALHGRPPFASPSIDGLLREKLTQRPNRSTRDVPAWLTDVIERGLAADPGERFPDMGALVAALERGRRRRFRTSALLFAPLVSLAVLGMHAAESSADERCTAEISTRASTVWNDDARASVRAGLSTAGKPRVADEVIASIDTHVAAWTETRTEVCAAVDEHAPQAESLACLDEALVETSELVQLLADADPLVAKAALEAARNLAVPGTCIEHGAGTESRELELLLRRARLHESVGRHASAAELLAQVLADPRLPEAPIAAARAHALACRIALYRDDREVARQTCDVALASAQRAGHTMLETAGLVRLAEASAPEPAELLLRMAEARLDAQPDGAPSLHAQLLLARVKLREEQHRLGDAALEARRALAYAESAFAPDSIQVAAAINAVANSESRAGHYTAATAAYGRAIALTTALRGADDIDMGALLHNKGGVELDRGAPGVAIGDLVRALELKTAAAGSESPRVVNTLQRIARAWQGLGEHATALAVARRAVTLSDGGDPLLSGRSLLVLAAVQHGADQCDEALATVERARVQLLAANAGDDDLGEAAWLRGVCELAGGSPGAGLHLQAGLDALSRYYGADARDLVRPLLSLASWHLRHGEADRARALLQRARTIVRSTEGDPRDAEAVERALTDAS